jgi:hypothetical protein
VFHGIASNVRCGPARIILYPPNDFNAADDCSCGPLSVPEISCYCVASRLPLAIERGYEHTREPHPTIGKLDASGVGVAVVYRSTFRRRFICSSFEFKGVFESLAISRWAIIA